MKILIAVDGSVFGVKALDYVLGHSTMFGQSSLALIHVAQPLPLHAAATVGPETVAAQYAHEHDEALRTAREHLRAAGRDASEMLKIGNPGVMIAQEAEEGGHDLVVMGSYGHGTLVGLLLGSTVRKVLAACRNPVLVIR